MHCAALCCLFRRLRMRDDRLHFDFLATSDYFLFDLFDSSAGSMEPLRLTYYELQTDPLYKNYSGLVKMRRPSGKGSLTFEGMLQFGKYDGQGEEIT